MGEDKVSIESIGHPLAFEVEPGVLELCALPPGNGISRVRTMARALAGMQKEAIVQNGPGGKVWRVVCDEGPWLNGTDLAPFPLAFFAAGLAASIMSEVLAAAGEGEVPAGSIRLVQDNFFTMEGSALRGTMKAGVLPMQLDVIAQGATEEWKDAVSSALRDRCPAVRCLQEALASGFAIRANGEPLPWPGVPARSASALDDPLGLFPRLRPRAANGLTIISKTAGAEDARTEAVGLKTQQKRVVHLHSECSVLESGLKAVDVQCIQPAGSRFRLLSDESIASGGQERAPDGLAWLAAGVAFCFMTQIGRYAQITKQQLDDYRIVQDTACPLTRDIVLDTPAIETLVLLETGEPAAQSVKAVQMSEQTCYVHASFQSAVETELSFSSGLSAAGTPTGRGKG